MSIRFAFTLLQTKAFYSRFATLCELVLKRRERERDGGLEMRENK